MVTRRGALRRGLLACGGVATAGCTGGGGDGEGGGGGRLLAAGFETGLDPWETRGHVGADAGGEFEWEIARSDERAHEGRWSLRMFTGGRFDDLAERSSADNRNASGSGGGTAWAVRPLDVPADASGLRVAL
ncbi:MAG: hypothetical protein ABEJ34_08110 [Haloferacaceae archaeon]